VVLWLVSDDKQIHDAGKVTVVKHKLDLGFLFFGVCTGEDEDSWICFNLKCLFVIKS
jgi:hypothetical protein